MRSPAARAVHVLSAFTVAALARVAAGLTRAELGPDRRVVGPERLGHLRSEAVTRPERPPGREGPPPDHGPVAEGDHRGRARHVQVAGDDGGTSGQAASPRTSWAS